MKKDKILGLLSLYQSVGKHLEKEKIFNNAVKILKKIIKCDGCAILFFDRGNVEIYSTGFSKTLKKKDFKKDATVISQILKTGKEIISGDVQKNKKLKKCIPTGSSFCSLLCVPLKIKGKIKGIIHLDSKEKNKFTKDDIHFVKLLAEELSGIIERSILYTKMKELATKDSLTGAFVRRILYSDMEREINRAERYKKPFSIIMIDVDNFKKYNDKFGHLKGDKLLKNIVKIIKSKLRKVDTVYRFGGDEFVILLPETDRKGAEKLCERLKKEIEKKDIKIDEKYKVSISTGIASSPADGKTRKELIEKADKNMYVEKLSKNGNQR